MTLATLHDLEAKANEIEAYLESHFWDPNGILYAHLDLQTERPFAREVVTPATGPTRADIDQWGFWTYEDSVLATGLLIDGLMRKYAVTGDAHCLEQALRGWTSLKNIYSCSQVFGIGSFLRPYGGFEGMGAFAEPLGSDQASPMLSGLYLLCKHVDEKTRREIETTMVRTLSWYEQQNFSYFYYKYFIHEWDWPLQHAASYYLPAIAWAAQITGEPRWTDYLHEKLALFRDPRFTLAQSFCWGSDLPILAELCGPLFGETFSPEMLDAMYAYCLKELARYDQPGMFTYLCPEAKAEGFTPYMRPGYDRATANLHCPYYDCIHQGRALPRQEWVILAALAALGYPGAYEQSLPQFSLRTKVPYDFTFFAYEDYEALPEDVSLYARSIPATLLTEWMRNYWLLRGVERAAQ